MKILIADDVHELLCDGLKELGYEVSYQPAISRHQIIETIGEYDGLVIRTKTHIDIEVLSNAKKLKFIGRAGAGLDNIDEAYCAQHQISCFNAGEANSDAVGEQTIGMLLALMTNIVKADKEVRKRVWDRQGNTGDELAGKTVGIIGYGNTGKAVARKLRGFGVTLMAYDKYLSNFGDEHVREVSLTELQQSADVVTFHVPLKADTEKLFDTTFLHAMQKDFYLLNLSRGKVVDAKVLISGLDSGKIKGACLDVLENENLTQLSADEKHRFDELCKRDNVVFTPHIGGWTNQSYVKIAKVLLRKIKELTNS